jgi:hypothetical protein
LIEPARGLPFPASKSIANNFNVLGATFNNRPSVIKVMPKRTGESEAFEFEFFHFVVWLVVMLSGSLNFCHVIGVTSTHYE